MIPFSVIIQQSIFYLDILILLFANLSLRRMKAKEKKGLPIAAIIINTTFVLKSLLGLAAKKRRKIRVINQLPKSLFYGALQSSKSIKSDFLFAIHSHGL